MEGLGTRKVLFASEGGRDVSGVCDSRYLGGGVLLVV